MPTKKKPSVFVIMPFDDKLKNVYKIAIKQACAKAGAKPIRIDEQRFDRSIINRILENIREADAIIAETTGNNPNVMFETGYADACNKKLILITQGKAEDIPFDLRDYKHIIYNPIDLTYLIDELIPLLRWALEK